MSDEDTDLWSDDEWRAAMSTAEINDLPDSDFAYIEPGGEKDAEGKTTPRDLRHYPIHDKAHAANALSRASAAIKGDDADAKAIAEKAMPAILAACKKFGIKVSEKNSDEVENEQRDATSDLEKRIRIATSLGGNGRGLAVERRRSDTGNVEARADLTDKDNPKYILSGYASITGRSYPVGSFNETIARGAFKKTLGDKAQVVFLANHTGLPIASTANDTLSLSEDNVGLRFDAQLDPEDDDAMRVYRKVETGLLRECSFAFQAIDQEWSNDYTDRTLTQVSINKGDVSVVNFGANDGTNIAARGALEDFEREAIAFVAELMRNENRAGATISAATANKIQSVLDLVGSASGDLEQARTELSAIRGDEPTDDDEAEAARKTQAADANSKTPGSQGKSDGTSDNPPSGSSPRTTAEWMEYRADAADSAVMVALVGVMEGIKTAKAAQSADPDASTDIIDGEVWSHLEDACAAVMKAIVDQAIDMVGETQTNSAEAVLMEMRMNRLKERAARQRKGVN